MNQIIQHSFLPQEWKQDISEYRFFELLERVLGQRLSDSDKQWFAGCTCVEQFMARLVKSRVFQSLALTGSGSGIGRLGEFYICLRSDMRWEPRAGYDLWGALEMHDNIKAGKIEVKTGGPSIRTIGWKVMITGRQKILKADILIFIGMKRTYNPCDGVMLAIPRKRLVLEVEKQLLLRPNRIPDIHISKNEYNIQTNQLNQWYDFKIRNHSDLRNIISEHIHGKFIIIPQQLSLF